VLIREDIPEIAFKQMFLKFSLKNMFNSELFIQKYVSEVLIREYVKELFIREYVQNGNSNICWINGEPVKSKSKE
jgi:hypothetical protein